jgi:hypothetical protein
MQVINHNYEVRNIIIIIQHYPNKANILYYLHYYEWGNEQVITHIQECHGDSSQYITCKGKI